MKKDNKAATAKDFWNAYKDYDEDVDVTIVPYSEDNDNIKTMTTLQLDLLEEVCKFFDEGRTKLGPEVIRILKQLRNCLIMECGNRAIKLAEQEGDNLVTREHVLKSMNEITLELPL